MTAMSEINSMRKRLNALEDAVEHGASGTELTEPVVQQTAYDIEARLTELARQNEALSVRVHNIERIMDDLKNKVFRHVTYGIKSDG